MADGATASSCSSLALHLLRLQALTFERRLPLDPSLHGPFRASVTRRLERLFRTLTGLVKPSVVAEIGAHDAEYSIAMKQLLPQSRVCAFEAHPTVFERNQAQLAAAGIHFRHAAIVDRRGPVVLQVPINARGRAVETMGSVLPLPGRDAHRSFEVEGLTLDDAVAEADASYALWVDVEGAAYQVFTGASRVLATTRLVYVELEARPAWANQRGDRDVIEILLSYGLIPLARDIFRKKWQYNAIFIRADELEKQLIEELVADFLEPA